MAMTVRCRTPLSFSTLREIFMARLANKAPATMAPPSNWLRAAMADGQKPYCTASQGRTEVSEPDGALLMDSIGQLYGTTVVGGAYGDGVVYRLDRGTLGWHEVRLFSFGTSPA